MSNVLGRVNLFIVKGNPGNAKLPNNTNVLYSKKNQCNGLPKLSQLAFNLKGTIEEAIEAGDKMLAEA